MLTVRADPSKDAQEIGRLLRGQSVEVLEQRGASSLVRFRPSAEQHTLSEGWAATAHLSRFVC